MLILSLESAIASFGIWVVSGIYKIAASAFKIFFILANGELVSPEKYEIILNNCYVILGIVMLFIIAFSLLKTMVNPEDQKQGTSAIKKIIINLITSIILLALLPTVFSFAFDFQNSIFTQNTFGVFFGFGTAGNGTDDQVKTIEMQANEIVNNVFTAFFNVNTSHSSFVNICGGDNSSTTNLETCQQNIYEDTGFLDFSTKKTLLTVMSEVNENGNFSAYSGFSQAVADDQIEFNFLVSLIGGFILIYVAVSYCFDMAVRLVKLVFYQLIAPIPVMLRIIPEGKLSGTFNQWIKVTLTCYLEVFVRIIILYFCIFLCQAILDSEFLKTTYISYGLFPWLFTKAFILMGLITFMRQAPKLISDLTGIDSGNMKLGIKDKLAAGGAFTAGAVIGGGATAFTRNGLNAIGNIKNKWKDADGFKEKAKLIAGGIGSTAAGTASAQIRAGKAGLNAKSFGDMKTSASKGAQGAVDARDKRANYKAAHGGTFKGAMLGHAKDFGTTVKNWATDSSIEGLTKESNSMGKIASSYNTFNDTIENLLEKEQAKGGGTVFTDKNGFSDQMLNAYQNFNFMAQQRKAVQAAFNSGQAVTYTYAAKDADGKYIMKNGKHVMHTVTGTINADTLAMIEGQYVDARDNARDQLIDLSLAGSGEGTAYEGLSAKGQAAMKDSLVNAETVKATILENANTKVVQEIMGANGNGSLGQIITGGTIDHEAFTHNGTKLKDAAKVAQGQADIKIAEMNKEKAAKGDK